MGPFPADHRWIFVEDSPFLPARGGGELEHLGMLRAAARAGVLALVVLPSERGLDLAPYRSAVGDVAIVTTPRRTSPVRLAHPRLPYVVASRPAPRDLLPRVATLAPDATGVVLTSYKSWRIGRLLAQGLGLPAVLRMHNREGAYHASLARGTTGPRGVALRWESMRIESDECRLGRATWLAGIADISQDDARWRRTTGARNVVAIPPFAFDPGQPGRERSPGADRVLFLGALDVATNVVALRWLLERVWPTVRAHRPTAVLDVVGRAPTTDVRSMVAGAARTRLVADVPDVWPYLSRATVAVNPAVSGSGVNIKLIEYLHAGIPLVSTSLATRGLPLRPGVDLEVHDDPAAFARAVVALLQDPRRAERMGETGRQHLLGQIDPMANLERVAQLMTAPA